ncbi:Pentatricopeptide repeat [Macleaya cordata]|uniref:Pentatricopeptide repeat n=1 Tax=Macleaya cordata TaxID=56857 RepID=A0A200Q8U9_MACCD|nr:Pentatricopeptide repeat [Macleaya cordata]
MVIGSARTPRLVISLKQRSFTFYYWVHSFNFAAHELFDKSPQRDEIHRFSSFCDINSSFQNSLCSGFVNYDNDQQGNESTISELAKQGHFQEALKSFHSLHDLGIKPTKFTFCTVLNSCSKLLDLCLGLQIHARIIQIGYEDNLFINSALVGLYSKCDMMVDARNVFYRMRNHDQVSWTSIITGFAQNGHGKEALVLFKEMLETSIRPDCFTFTSVISACTQSEAALEEAALLHVHVIKLGFEQNSSVISSLVDCYSKCGKIDRAISVFNSTLEKDTILVNTMIAGYSQNLLGEEALRLFTKMRKDGLCPTDYTFGSVLNACGSLTILQQGRQIHSLLTKTGSDRNVFVASSLIDMYSKCGTIDEARKIFDQTIQRNNVLWTSMITGYAQSGRGEDALELFENLVREGLKPDRICFTAVLTACNHGGFLDKGIEYLNKMKTYFGLVPELDQFACMVDLYGRNGHLRKARELMEEMPFEPNAVIWTSFLGSCRVHREVELGREAAKQLLKLEPNSPAPYVTLANIYADAGMWEEVKEVRKMMKEKGMRKSGGWSWVEIEQKFHVFSVNDTSHPQMQEIYAELYKLYFEMREAGYTHKRKYV